MLTVFTRSVALLSIVYHHVELIGLDITIPQIISTCVTMLSGVGVNASLGSTGEHPPSLVFSWFSPRHLHRAQRRHLASQVCPPLLLPSMVILQPSWGPSFTLHGHFKTQLGSFLLIHSQLLLQSFVCQNALVKIEPFLSHCDFLVEQ